MRRMWKGEVEAKIRRKKSYDLETRLNPPDISFNPLSVWHIHHFPLISRYLCFRYLRIGGLLQYQYHCYFLVTCTRLYNPLCPSVRRFVYSSVRPSVHLSVHWSVGPSVGNAQLFSSFYAILSHFKIFKVNSSQFAFSLLVSQSFSIMVLWS